MLRSTHRVIFICSLIMSCFVIGSVSSAPFDPAASDTTPTCAERLTLTAEKQTWQIPYCSSHSLDVPSAVERVVIGLHGINEAAPSMQDTLLEAAQGASVVEQTLLITPHWLIPAQRANYADADRLLYWDDGAYQWGQVADNAALSAFDVLDSLVRVIFKRQFPNLDEVVLVGFGDGAELLNRYAALSQIERELSATEARFRYVIASADDYLYFSTQRRVALEFERFITPNHRERSGCLDYNDYGYGLNRFEERALNITAQQARQQYARRRVYYLVGAGDTGTDGWSCQQHAQGMNRLDRARVYYHHLGQEFGEAIYEQQQLAVLPMMGHDLDMLLSNCARVWIFDADEAIPCRNIDAS